MNSNEIWNDSSMKEGHNPLRLSGPSQAVCQVKPLWSHNVHKVGSYIHCRTKRAGQNGRLKTFGSFVTSFVNAFMYCFALTPKACQNELPVPGCQGMCWENRSSTLTLTSLRTETSGPIFVPMTITRIMAKCCEAIEDKGPEQNESNSNCVLRIPSLVQR